MNNLKILSGIDIVDNNKIKKLLLKHKNLSDLFSQKEIEYCRKKYYPEQSYGVRFAAKEAIIKATYSKILEYELNLIEIINNESGIPVMQIKCNRLVDKIKSLLNKDEFMINLSLSHERDYSIAYILIY